MTLPGTLATYAPKAGLTRLVLDPTVDRPIWTIVRETDARTALARGLAEYLSDLSIVWAGGRTMRFKKVLQTWAEPEIPGALPAAIVYGTAPGAYDPDSRKPGSSTSSSDVIAGSPRIWVSRPVELVQTFTVQLWADDPLARLALSAMLEDALEPSESISGFVLELPHYHGARGTFLKTDVTYVDSAVDAQTKLRTTLFSVTATVPQVRLLGGIPDFRAMPRYEITDVRTEIDPER